MTHSRAVGRCAQEHGHPPDPGEHLESGGRAALCGRGSGRPHAAQLTPHSPAWGPRPARPCRFYFLPSKNGAEGGRKTHLKTSPETWPNSRRVSAPENSLPGHPGGRPWPPAPQIKGPPPTLPTVAARKELSLVQAECDASRLT